MPDDLPTRADIYAATDGPLSDDDRRQLDRIERRSQAVKDLQRDIERASSRANRYASAFWWTRSMGDRGAEHLLEKLREAVADQVAALAAYERGL